MKLNSHSREELKKIDYLEFNIFKIKDETENNELVTVTSLILAKEGIFEKVQLQLDTYMMFMSRI
jgi:hypothetical protein